MRGNTDTLRDSTPAPSPQVGTSSPAPRAPPPIRVGSDLLSAQHQRFLWETHRARIRVVAPMLFVLSVSASPLAFVAPALWLRPLALAGFATHAFCYAVMFQMARQPSFDQARVSRAALALGPATVPLLLLFGTASLFVAFVIVGLLIHNMETQRRYALATSLSVAIPHLFLDIANSAGWMEAPGLWHRGPEELQTPLLDALALIGLYGLTIIVGQAYRQRHELSSKSLARSTAETAAQAAQARALRAELDHAMSIGQPGRYTDLKLGSYIVGVLIGRGGMGEVYAASHLDTRETQSAAVKVLRLRPSMTKGAVDTFVNEARALTSLDSPHIAKVLEVGEVSSGLPYIATERLSGQTLEQILTERPQLPPDELIALVTQVATGLAAAHRSGVVHRDVKPSNLWRTNERQWKVLDFGVARLNEDDALGGSIVGTPRYMAPEQVHTPLHVDERADVYGLAAVTYRCLVGLPPPAVDEPPVRPPSGVPKPVLDVLDHALATAPDERTASVADFAGELTGVLSRTMPNG